jgi:hypothetical protein
MGFGLLDQSTMTMLNLQKRLHRRNVPLQLFSILTDPHPTPPHPYNALTTTKHFNVYAHPYDHHDVLVPSYYGHKCKGGSIELAIRAGF